MARQKVAREITVLVRYTVKATGNVVLYVENDKGDRYYVTLQSNGNAACNCKATRKCYHIARCTEMEAARQEVAIQFASKNAPIWFVELVAKGIVVAPKVVETVAQEEVPPIAMELPAELKGYRKTAVSSDLKCNINGAQQSAALLMALPSRRKTA